MGREAKFFTLWLAIRVAAVLYGLKLWRDPYLPDRYDAAWLVYGGYPPEHIQRGARRIAAGATIAFGAFMVVFSVAVLVTHLPFFD